MPVPMIEPTTMAKDSFKPSRRSKWTFFISQSSPRRLFGLPPPRHISTLHSVRADVEPHAVLCHFHALAEDACRLHADPLSLSAEGAPPWLTSTAAARTISCH